MSTTTRITSAWQCVDLPLWIRVALYAEAHHGERMARDELRLALDPTRTPHDIRRAITRGIGAGLLAYDSTTRCLYTRVGRS